MRSLTRCSSIRSSSFLNSGYVSVRHSSNLIGAERAREVNRAVYRMVYKRSATYWAGILGSAVVLGYAFDAATLAVWENWNKGKLFADVIHTFPEKYGEEEEEEDEEEEDEE